jgi:hypothetical protein
MLGHHPRPRAADPHLVERAAGAVAQATEHLIFVVLMGLLKEPLRLKVCGYRMTLALPMFQICCSSAGWA